MVRYAPDRIASTQAAFALYHATVSSNPWSNVTVGRQPSSRSTFVQSIARVLCEKRLVCELTFFSPLLTEGRSRREVALAAEQLVRERIRGHSRRDR